MITYRIQVHPFIPTLNSVSYTAEDGRAVMIPFDLANTDCAKFLQDWKNGAEVLDADGNPLPYSDEALAALEVKP